MGKSTYNTSSNYVDKQILIANDGDKYVMAINISDSDPNNWKHIWRVGADKFTDIIIVDESVILTNGGQEMAALDVNTYAIVNINFNL